MKSQIQTKVNTSSKNQWSSFTIPFAGAYLRFEVLVVLLSLAYLCLCEGYNVSDMGALGIIFFFFFFCKCKCGLFDLEQVSKPSFWPGRTRRRHTYKSS